MRGANTRDGFAALKKGERLRKVGGGVEIPEEGTFALGDWATEEKVLLDSGADEVLHRAVCMREAMLGQRQDRFGINGSEGLPPRGVLGNDSAVEGFRLLEEFREIEGRDVRDIDGEDE